MMFYTKPSQKISKPILLVLALSCGSSLFASVTGKIAGTVVDETSGQPLQDARIVVESIERATSTDTSGHYHILNVPVGLHSVSVIKKGYVSVLKDSVEVHTDLTTCVDFEMELSTAEDTQITASARQSIVLRDATSTTGIISSAEISARPSPTIEDAIAAQPSVFLSEGGASGATAGLHLRGGRAYEVVYMIDGIASYDRFMTTTGAQIGVDATAIQEMQVITGGFNAEYGKTMSGVVNIITKEGKHSQANLSYRTDMPFSGCLDRGNHSIEGNVGGPLPFHNRFLCFLSGNISHRDQRHHFDFPLSNTDEDSYSTLAKLTYRFSPSLQAGVTGALSRDQNGIWGVWSSWGTSGKYIPPEYRFSNLRKTQQIKATLTHSLTPGTFYTLNGICSGSRSVIGERDFEWEAKRKHWEDYKFKPWWTYVRDPLRDHRAEFWNATYYDPDYPDSGTAYAGNDSVYWYPHGVPGLAYLGEPGAWFDRKSIHKGVVWSLTSQVTEHHQLKLGVDWWTYNLSGLEIQDIYCNSGIVPVIDANGNVIGKEILPDKRDKENCLWWNEYETEPWESAVYLQDKIEYSRFIANIGVRCDYFAPNSWKYRDPFNPYKSVFTPEADTTLVPDTVHAQPQYQVSPRLSVAVPVTQRIVLRASYGHFLQMPVMICISDVQKTVAYELGASYKVMQGIAIDVTAFLKRVTYDVPGTKYEQESRMDCTSCNAKDRGDAQGLELLIRKKATEWLSGQVSYALQSVNGTRSYTFNGNNYDCISNLPTDTTVKTIYPLEFDRRHSLKSEIGLQIPAEAGRLGRTLLTLTNEIGSGIPYTERDTEGHIVGTRNGKRMPWTWVSDLRIEKRFSLFGQKLIAFAETQNLFNRKNVTNIYPLTGNPHDPGAMLDHDYYIENTFPAEYASEDKLPVYEEDGEHSYRSADKRRDLNNDGYITTEEWYQSYQNAYLDLARNPTHYSDPCHVNIGMSITW